MGESVFTDKPSGPTTVKQNVMRFPAVTAEAVQDSPGAWRASVTHPAKVRAKGNYGVEVDLRRVTESAATESDAQEGLKGKVIEAVTAEVSRRQSKGR